MSNQDKLSLFSKLLEKMNSIFVEKFGVSSEQVFVSICSSVSVQINKLNFISDDDKISLVNNYLQKESFIYHDPLFNRGYISINNL